MAMDVQARIEGLRPFLIHGEHYVVVYYSHLDDVDTIRHAQVSADALPEGLRVGEVVTLTSVLNVVAGIRRIARDADCA